MTLFRSKQEFKNHFFNAVDATKFPVEILWGIFAEMKFHFPDFIKWADDSGIMKTTLTGLEEPDSLFAGGSSVVLVDLVTNKATKLFSSENTLAGTLFPFASPGQDPLFFLIELCNYFIFKTVITFAEKSGVITTGTWEMFNEIESLAVNLDIDNQVFQVGHKSSVRSEYCLYPRNLERWFAFFQDLDKLDFLGACLIHGDFKANNIMADLDGNPKIIDFGISLYGIFFENGDDPLVSNNIIRHCRHYDMAIFALTFGISTLAKENTIVDNEYNSIFESLTNPDTYSFEKGAGDYFCREKLERFFAN